MSKSPLKIEIYSDIVCPWCFIGKHNLFKALSKVSHLYDIDISWRPFELNPNLPPEGKDRAAYRLEKFGSLERSRALEGQVEAAAREEGLTLHMDKIDRVPNTFLSHRLSRFAMAHQRQAAVMENMFKAYFVDGQDVGELEVLLDVAERSGLDRQEVQRHLESDDGVEQLRTEEMKTIQLGVNGVPFFRINDVYGISGAQPPDRFIRAFREASELMAGVAAGDLD